MSLAGEPYKANLNHCIRFSRKRQRKEQNKSQHCVPELPEAFRAEPIQPQIREHRQCNNRLQIIAQERSGCSKSGACRGVFLNSAVTCSLTKHWETNYGRKPRACAASPKKHQPPTQQHRTLRKDNLTAQPKYQTHGLTYKSAATCRLALGRSPRGSKNRISA